MQQIKFISSWGFDLFLESILIYGTIYSALNPNQTKHFHKVTEYETACSMALT